jgi:hypothetical protein
MLRQKVKYSVFKLASNLGITKLYVFCVSEHKKCLTCKFDTLRINIENLNNIKAT